MELIEGKLSDEEYPISEDEGSDFEYKKSSFASSIAKILKNENDENSEQKNRKSIILSKAKKAADKKQKPIGFEIVGDVKQEQDSKPSEEDLKFALQRKNYLERKKVS